MCVFAFVVSPAPPWAALRAATPGPSAGGPLPLANYGGSCIQIDLSLFYGPLSNCVSKQLFKRHCAAKATVPFGNPGWFRSDSCYTCDVV